MLALPEPHGPQEINDELYEDIDMDDAEDLARAVPLVNVPARAAEAPAPAAAQARNQHEVLVQSSLQSIFQLGCALFLVQLVRHLHTSRA